MKLTRREFIGGLAAAGVAANSGFGFEGASPIDRKALVSRHDPVITKFEPMSPLSVGNGEFVFTCDVTGLQTFPELYKDAMPLCTMSQWGWHTTPLPENLKGKELRLQEYDTPISGDIATGRNATIRERAENGNATVKERATRKVGYMTSSTDQKELFDYLRENPHRLHLGQIGFDFGPDAKPEDITDIEQRLELWTGIIHSRFKFKGEDIYVRTAVHPKLDVIAVNVESKLLAEEGLEIKITFPYASSSMPAADWDDPDRHKSDVWVQTTEPAVVVIDRFLDQCFYCVGLQWDRGIFEKKGPHEFSLKSNGATRLECSVFFINRVVVKEIIPSVKEIFEANATYWKSLWTTGAAVDLSQVKDERAKELERRIVLSQYQTKINCSGSLPPQETGLVCNSWYGKFHLEMHWWHAAHFALWGRFPLLEKSLQYYNDILPSARDRAKQQGYAGARWPKMTAPDGRDSPSPIGPLLVWQQPHPIFYAELAYLNKPTAETLKKYKDIVFESAEFMASYAYLENGRYVLGPPVIPAQENHPPRETWNPTFELEYWHFGLTTAQKWRERLGMKRDAKWADVIAGLSPLPIGVGSPTVREGASQSQGPFDSQKTAGAQRALPNGQASDTYYLAHENCPQTFTERNKDHPSMLGALGILSGEKVDRETMRRTLHKVLKEWDWPETWGWDYPMVAMTAARLNEPETAIDALLLDTPKNHYLPNGHNYQRPNLPLYLPGNGGLLYAIALMAGGWKGSPKRPTPGFPASWKVKAEGFDPNILQKL